MYIAVCQCYPKSTYSPVHFLFYLFCRHKMHIFRSVALRRSFWFALQACTFDISFIIIWYILQCVPKLQKIHIFFLVFLVEFNLPVLNIFRLNILRGSFWYALHVCTLDISLIKIWYLVFIAVCKYVIAKNSHIFTCISGWVLTTSMNCISLDFLS